MTEEARKARNAYAREYRKKNHERLLEYHRKWRADNKEKIKATHERYWEKKSLKSS